MELFFILISQATLVLSFSFFEEKIVFDIYIEKDPTHMIGI